VNTSAVIATGQAPGKIILFGEHAVVYGRPAIAAPLHQLRAYANVFEDDECVVEAPDIGRRLRVAEATREDPLAQVVRLVCSQVGRPLPRWRVVVRSQIPVASGLGSGAAVAAAMARALLSGFGVDWPPEQLSALVYEVEKMHHGSPSGVDNTVVVYGRPVWFVRGLPPEPFAVGAPLHLLIADTGIASPTRVVVSDVRAAWESAPSRFEALFDRIGQIAQRARAWIEAGRKAAVGEAMDENHALLNEIGVGSPELDRLCTAARGAGAMGAKLSGGGRGGNMIALARPENLERVEQALLAAGARQVVGTQLLPLASDRT
jgi:mevalonate kinase